jgi:voltage-gated potassium channel
MTNQPQDRTSPVPSDADEHALREERWGILRQLESWLEGPMVLLGIAWLVILVVELVRGASTPLTHLSTIIWIIFIADFALKLTLAPAKVAYVRSNWISVLALFVPALRVFRIFRALRVLRVARATSGIRLVRVLGAANRGMRALGRTFGRRGFGYVLALTVMVTLVGAAGIYALESANRGGTDIETFGGALWWTAMLITTMGTSFWPQTPEGRLLSLSLAVYAFAIFGYITATIATFFIGQDVRDGETDAARTTDIGEIRKELAQLRVMLSEQSRVHHPRGE